MAAANRDRLYGRLWRKARRLFLSQNPYCKYCKDDGRIVPAVDVDHITPHKGDPVLFWDERNLQGLCKYHHQVVKAAVERNGKTGVDEGGMPLDPEHHWNA